MDKSWKINGEFATRRRSYFSELGRLLDVPEFFLRRTVAVALQPVDYFYGCPNLEQSRRACESPFHLGTWTDLYLLSAELNVTFVGCRPPVYAWRAAHTFLVDEEAHSITRVEPEGKSPKAWPVFNGGRRPAASELEWGRVVQACMFDNRVNLQTIFSGRVSKRCQRKLRNVTNKSYLPFGLELRWNCGQVTKWVRPRSVAVGVLQQTGLRWQFAGWQPEPGSPLTRLSEHLAWSLTQPTGPCLAKLPDRVRVDVRRRVISVPENESVEPGVLPPGYVVVKQTPRRAVLEPGPDLHVTRGHRLFLDWRVVYVSAHEGFIRRGDGVPFCWWFPSELDAKATWASPPRVNARLVPAVGRRGSWQLRWANGKREVRANLLHRDPEFLEPNAFLGKFPRFRVGPSTVELPPDDPGEGLFAVRNLLPRVLYPQLCYTGEALPRGHKRNSMYVWGRDASNGHLDLDATQAVGWARKVNSAEKVGSDGVVTLAVRPNLRSSMDAYLVRRPVCPGEELLTIYGPTYWNASLV